MVISEQVGLVVKIYKTDVVRFKVRNYTIHYHATEAELSRLQIGQSYVLILDGTQVINVDFEKSIP